jgi:hypothetical protein
MNKAKCVLCGHDAKSKSFTEAEPDEHGRVNVAGGFAYDCPKCGLYALDGFEHNFVEYRATEEQKETLSNYVKSHPDEDGLFKVLRWNDIKRILKLF